jgi:hypothetical protein
LTLTKAVQLEFGRGPLSAFQKSSRAATIALKAKKAAALKASSKRKAGQIKEEIALLIVKKNRHLAAKKVLVTP